MITKNKSNLTKKRLLAINILETIASMLGDETIFDCKDDDDKWYKFEDAVTKLIEED